MKSSYTIRPIGRVDKTASSTVLTLFPEFVDGLLGMEGFSHVIVLYWFDQNDTPEKRNTLQVHPRKNRDNPLTGVFAARSPARPNLIAHSTCEVLGIQDGRIRVDDIDAHDGTPIIDIKPYIPASDLIPDARVPDWVPDRD